MSVVNVKALAPLDFNVESYSEIFKAYKEDLENYIQSFSGKRDDDTQYAKDYFLSKLTERWQPILDFNQNRILRDIQELQTPKTEFIASLGLKEALAHYKPAGAWLIPNLLRAHGAMYLLGGEPKAGKSLLVNFLIYGVALSGEFLGRPVKTGNVLYIQLEESLDTIGERLFLAGFGDITDEDTSMVVNFGHLEEISRKVQIERVFDITSDLDWLIKKIQEVKPALVVVDSLRAASVKSSASENSNEFGKLVISLQQVFNVTNTCGVVIHHMSKLGGRNVKKTSLIERLAGHTSISAACSGIIGIMSEETQTGRLMTLKTLPRNGTPLTLTYQIKTSDEGLWKLEKQWEDTPINSPFTSKILRFLANNPDEYYSQRTLAKEIGVELSNVDFKEALLYLQNSQIITKKYQNKKFHYSLPSDSLWIVNPQSVKQMCDNETIIDANNMVRCGDRETLRSLVSMWSKERQLKATEVLLAEERARIKQLMCSWEYEVGDVALYDGVKVTVKSKHSASPSLTRNEYVIDFLGEDTIVSEQALSPVSIVAEEVEDDEELILIDTPIAEEELTFEL